MMAKAGVCKACGAGSEDRSPEIRTRGFSSKSWPKDTASGNFFSVRLQLLLGNVKGTCDRQLIPARRNRESTYTHTLLAKNLFVKLQ